MTVYFDQRAHAQKEQEEVEALSAELEAEKNRQLGVKAVTTLISTIVKPALLMLLWNWLMPGIFGLAAIGYFKALGLYVLARIFIDKDD